MATFEKVPIVEVHNENINEVWPSLSLAIKTATFIGIDTELSGLGERKKLIAKSMDDRYSTLCEVAKSRSVLSIGLSCFKLTNVVMSSPSQTTNGDLSGGGDGDGAANTGPKHRKWTYVVQTFNILLLCDQDYVVEPLALRFLVDHGFDFNRQYALGIPYYRGNDKKEDQEESSMMRRLFSMIIQSEVAVVFHNALVDLVFLYQSFYANLPQNSANFLADLSEMFPSGIFDTKYITDFIDRPPASYLQYVFNKCYRDFCKDFGTNSVISLNFPSYPTNYAHVSHSHCKMYTTEQNGQHLSPEQLKRRVCESYAAHGWCKQATSCPKSHDIGLILDLDSFKVSKSSRRRKRKQQQQQEDEDNQQDDQGDKDTSNMEISDVPDLETNIPAADIEMAKDSEKTNSTQEGGSSDGKDTSRSGGHRAGFDSFMTGFILASYISKYGSIGDETQLDFKSLGVDKFKNSVYLTGKDIPWSIQKGGFAKPSKDHRQKLAKLKS